MTFLPGTCDAADELSRAVDALEEAYADGRVAPFDRARRREAVFKANRRFKEQRARPVIEQVQLWTPHSPRNSIIAHHPGCAL